MNRKSPEQLRFLRHGVDMVQVLLDLSIPRKVRGRRVAYRCPSCEDLHMRIHRPSNRACCFRCRQSFNTIDLVMAERKTRFVDAVEYLERLLSRQNLREVLVDPHR